MEISKISLQECPQAKGVVVVVDVLRAFSTAAYAMAFGALEIILAGTVEQAFELRERYPDYFLIGEVGGLKVEGFDYGNSPTELAGQDLRGRGLIHRTSAGTQGVVRSHQAETLFTASFVVASATARLLRRIAPSSLTFVISGYGPDGSGAEDASCADYIQALLSGDDINPAPFIQRVLDSPEGLVFADPSRPEFPVSDLEYCTVANRFDFALQVERRNSLNVLKVV